MKPYQLSIKELLTNLYTDTIKGLSSDEVIKRREQYGSNILPSPPKISLIIVFLRQFQSPLIYLLLIAAAIIFFIGDPVDALVISGVLFFNAIVGTIQEGRTERMLESLRTFLKTQVLVIRDGKRHILSAQELVPGDLIIVQEGEKVPADARLLESKNLLINESMLTGESKGITKTIEVIEKEMPVADQDNMIFKGTYILSGYAKAVVVATGQKTEIGKIGRAIEEIETEMPLKREVDTLSHYILYFIFAMCVFLFAIGLWQGKSLPDLLVMLTALFICVIPEGLPVIMTLTLVTGAYRMAKDNVLVKRLQAAEGLGRTDVILIDKTGTLTRNEMIVSRIFSNDTTFDITGQGYAVKGSILKNSTPLEQFDESLLSMGRAVSLLNSTEIEYVPRLNLFNIKGDPTEAAMYVFSQKLGLDKEHLLQEYKPLYELPFQPELRYQAGIYQKGDKVLVYIVGAPEVVMQKSKTISENTKKILTSMLDEGLRVIAVAKKELLVPELPEGWQGDSKKLKQLLENYFSFLGFYGIEDSIRPEVPHMVHEARKAGLRVIMATGDHKETALFVGKKVGIFEPNDLVIDGSEIDTLSDEELLKILDNVTIFSRVSPQHKLRIVKLLQKQGNIVAMTGDGVNDAPSLVAADLGVAMGAIGTEVAKQASDMILLDDSFSSVIKAIEQGRHIFATLRRVITYFFTTNMAEVLIVLFALLTNLPLPLLAVQILWLNLITDGFLDVALSLEPRHNGGLLENSVVQRIDRLVDWKIFAKMVYLSIPMAIGSLAIFYWYYQQNIQLARTMTLVTMAMYQWFNAWNCRSEKYSLFKIGIFSNYWLIFATIFVLGLQMLLLYTPLVRSLFKTVPLTLHEWGIIILFTAPLFFLEEIRKVVMSHLFKKNNI